MCRFIYTFPVYSYYILDQTLLYSIYVIIKMLFPYLSFMNVMFLCAYTAKLIIILDMPIGYYIWPSIPIIHSLHVSIILV